MLNPRDDEDRKDGHPVSQEGQSDCILPEHRICDSILPQFFVLCKHHLITIKMTNYTNYSHTTEKHCPACPAVIYSIKY